MISEMVGTKYISFMGRPQLWGIPRNQLKKSKHSKKEKMN